MTYHIIGIMLFLKEGMEHMRWRKQASETWAVYYTEFANEPIIFDGFLFTSDPSLFYFADGRPGMRCLFISDENTGCKITFEEGARRMDESLPSETHVVRYIPAEYRSGERYIHQIRSDPETRPGIGNYAFFHMEIPDETGELHILPGEMTAPAGIRGLMAWNRF